MRTRADERVVGTHTFLVHALSSGEARTVASSLAADERARAHRRGASLCEQDSDVTWVGPVFTATSFPLVGTAPLVGVPTIAKAA